MRSQRIVRKLGGIGARHGRSSTGDDRCFSPRLHDSLIGKFFLAITAVRIALLLAVYILLAGASYEPFDEVRAGVRRDPMRASTKI
jgi:hypothetical protein